MPLPPAQFKYGAELGALSDEYNKSVCGEGRPRSLKDKSQLPTLHGDLLYSSLGTPSSAPYLNCAGGKGNGFGLVGRLTYKFYGAWWPRVASWRCFSGFVV